MICFMFPGQPLARPASLPADEEFAAIADLTRRLTRLDLESFEWLEGEGSEDLKLQLFGVAYGLYRLRCLRAEGVRPDLVAEHSMGIYPALAACGCISEADAIEMTWRVGSALSRMAGPQQYALGCVIGLTLEPVLALARDHGVHLANHNTSRHFLLSGTRPAMAATVAEALAAGAFSARSLDCDAPLHSPLMAPLDQELREVFAGYRYAEPAAPLLDHLEQKHLAAHQIPEFLLRELSLPVYWERSYRSLRDQGTTRCYEVGTGEALKKYNRWIDSEYGN